MLFECLFDHGADCGPSEAAQAAAERGHCDGFQAEMLDFFYDGGQAETDILHA